MSQSLSNLFHGTFSQIGQHERSALLDKVCCSRSTNTTRCTCDDDDLGVQQPIQGARACTHIIPYCAKTSRMLTPRRNTSRTVFSPDTFSNAFVTTSSSTD